MGKKHMKGRIMEKTMELRKIINKAIIGRFYFSVHLLDFTEGKLITINMEGKNVAEFFWEERPLEEAIRESATQRLVEEDQDFYINGCKRENLQQKFDENRQYSLYAHFYKKDGEMSLARYKFYELKSNTELVLMMGEECKEEHRVREKLEGVNRILQKVNESLAAQMSIIGSLSSIYLSCYHINVQNDTYEELHAKKYIKEVIPREGMAQATLNHFIDAFVQEVFSDYVRSFVDMSTLDKRLSDKKVISQEYVSKFGFWVRIMFIPVEKDGNGKIREVLFVCQDVTHEHNMDQRMSRQLYDDIQMQNKILERERKMYRDALISDSVHNYTVDVTDGLLLERFVTESGMNILQMLELSVPVKYDFFNEQIIRFFKVRFLREDGIEPFLCENMAKEYEEGKTTIEMEYYIPSLDRYFRSTALLSTDDGNGHIMAFVIGRDITQIRKSEEDTKLALKQAYEAANQATAAKTNFLSNMSHDIRTPMNAIIGMTAIAQSYIEDTDRVRDALKKIDTSSRHLLGLVNEVLDMSKIESGKVDLSEKEFNLRELLTNLLNMMMPQAENRNHSLSMQIVELEHENVIGDSLRIQQVFVNILGNAIKYTPQGGILKVIVSEKKTKSNCVGCYEFVFEDNGIGMSKEFMDKIFEPFSRAEDSRVNKVQGTGLGMSITKSIVQLMNGNIQVESEEGKGSKFTITINLKLTDEKVMLEDSQTNVKRDYNFEGMRILLVEDNDINREVARTILEGTKVCIEEATDGVEALHKFQESEIGYYDLILMDVQMPRMNGYQSTEEIRKLERSDAANIPIIAMTANAFAEDVQAAKQAGMDEHLSKPIEIAVLMRTMQKWLYKNKI